jgi:hypothetical protein
MCPHTSAYYICVLVHLLTIYVSAYICLLYLCPHTSAYYICVRIHLHTIYVSSYICILYMCPHTSAHYICVLIHLHAIYVSSYRPLPTIWVLIHLYMCPHTSLSINYSTFASTYDLPREALEIDIFFYENTFFFLAHILHMLYPARPSKSNTFFFIICSMCSNKKKCVLIKKKWFTPRGPRNRTHFRSKCFKSHIWYEDTYGSTYICIYTIYIHMAVRGHRGHTYSSSK